MTAAGQTSGESGNTPLPPKRLLETALRTTTEFLANELARPTQVGPEWSDFEWRIARAVAAIHGVSPLLATRLRWEGPAAWQQFIHEQRAHTVRRHQRIQQLLSSIDDCGRREGVPLLALKGAALHDLGLYRPGERPMADVDLLVREADAPCTARLLGELGFVQSEVYWKHLTFTRRDPRPAHDLGEHSSNELKIELHVRIGEILPSRLTDITGLIFPHHSRPGLNSYRSAAALMTHLLLHAAGAMAYRSLRMLHLHDLALLSGRMTDADWSAVLRLPDRNRSPWWAMPPLLLTTRYYPSAVPTRVLSTLSADCAWWLRRLSRHRILSDVSLSYLWLEAFPGLEWAQSPGEMVEHVAKRIGRATQLVSGRKSQTAEGQTSTPLLDTRSAFSRAPYVLNWLISRPARPETMHAVRAALQSGK